MSPHEENSFDVVGIGFGPANLSLAIALQEMGESRETRLRTRFVERQGTYNWHPNMLLPGTRMQISFLKDLVTQRNPTSHYTFLNFLRLRGMLDDFINLRAFHPTREEFCAYFRWIARQFENIVEYGSDVQRVEPVVERDGTVRWLRVVANRANVTRHYLCRALAIAMGGRPRYLGEDTESLTQVVHSHDFLRKLSEGFKDADTPYRFAVVGAGQSAVEMSLYLYDRYPNAVITSFVSGFAYTQCDSSQFVNEIFMGRNTDAVFYGNPYTRSCLLDRRTNFGTVDVDDIRSLYSRIYLDRFSSRDRVFLRRFSRVNDVRGVGQRAEIDVEDLETGTRGRETFDGVFLGTGFERALDPRLFGSLLPYLVVANGAPVLARDYSLVATDRLKAKVFAQGISEDSHGIGSTLLSTLALRAEEIGSALVNAIANTGAAPAAQPQRARRPSIVGIAGPFSGKRASFGELLRNACTAARRDLGVPASRLLFVDDESEPGTATQVARRFIACGVGGVVGHFSSECAAAVAPLYHRARVPLLLPASTATQIPHLNEGYVYRLCPDNLSQAKACQEFLGARGVSSVSVIRDSSGYAADLCTALCAKQDASFSVRVSRDGSVQAREDEAVFLAGAYPACIAFAQRLALSSARPLVIACDDCDIDEFRAAVRETALNLYVMKPQRDYYALSYAAVSALCHHLATGSEIVRPSPMEWSLVPIETRTELRALVGS